MNSMSGCACARGRAKKLGQFKGKYTQPMKNEIFISKAKKKKRKERNKNRKKKIKS